MADIKVIRQAADFRMMKNEVSVALTQLPEIHKVYRFLILKMVLRIEIIEFDRKERESGKTKYPFSKMSKLALDSVASFSTKPLHLLTKAGFLLSISLFFLAVLTLPLSFIFKTVPGWTSITFLVLCGNAFTLFGIGVLGEYICRSFEQLQNRPALAYREIK